MLDWSTTYLLGHTYNKKFPVLPPGSPLAPGGGLATNSDEKSPYATSISINKYWHLPSTNKIYMSNNTTYRCLMPI